LVTIIPVITAGISEVACAPYPAYPSGTAYLAGHPGGHAPGYYPRVFPDIPGFQHYSYIWCPNSGRLPSARSLKSIVDNGKKADFGGNTERLIGNTNETIEVAKYLIGKTKDLIGKKKDSIGKKKDSIGKTKDLSKDTKESNKTSRVDKEERENEQKFLADYLNKFLFQKQKMSNTEEFNMEQSASKDDGTWRINPSDEGNDDFINKSSKSTTGCTNTRNPTTTRTIFKIFHFNTIHWNGGNGNHY
jgi:hypothetical protein